MKTDKEFLQWLYDRLKSFYQNSENLDWMQRFKRIVDDYPGGEPKNNKWKIS